VAGAMTYHYFHREKYIPYSLNPKPALPKPQNQSSFEKYRVGKKMQKRANPKIHWAVF